MSEEALAALGTEKAFSVCTAFIKSGGSDGKGTGVSNIPGQGQEERKVRHAASHSAPRSAAGPAQACSPGHVSGLGRALLPSSAARPEQPARALRHGTAPHEWCCALCELQG